jgi:hypothetical protein
MVSIESPDFSSLKVGSSNRITRWKEDNHRITLCHSGQCRPTPAEITRAIPKHCYLSWNWSSGALANSSWMIAWKGRKSLTGRINIVIWVPFSECNRISGPRM